MKHLISRQLFRIPLSFLYTFYVKCQPWLPWNFARIAYTFCKEESLIESYRRRIVKFSPIPFLARKIESTTRRDRRIPSVFRIQIRFNTSNFLSGIIVTGRDRSRNLHVSRSSSTKRRRYEMLSVKFVFSSSIFTIKILPRVIDSVSMY